MSTGEKVRMLRAKAGLSQRELAEAASTSHGTIARIESGAQPNPPVMILQAIAKRFRVPMDDLINPRVSLADILGGKKRPGGKEPTVLPLENLLQIPVVAYVPCGMPTEVPEEMIMGRISLPYEWVRDKQAFAVVAKGDSMTGHGIQTGDYVVISPTLEVQTGSIALVEINGDVTIKKVILREDQVVLQPSSHSYEPIFVSEKDEFRIIGKVVFSGRRHE